jgi:hypothetical protein
MGGIAGTAAGAVRRGARSVGGVTRFVASGLRGVAGVAPRTAAFLVGTSCQRVRGGPRAGNVPVPRLSLGLALHASADRWVVAVHQPWLPSVPASEIDRVAGEMREALALYATSGWLSDPASYHPAPPPLESPEISTRRTRTFHYEQLSFESGYRPHPGEPGGQRWLDDDANRTARAWMLRHDTPRPWVVLVHGSAMGYPWFDRRALRALWFHRNLGLNVMLPVLPKHGARKNGGALSIPFPTDDLLDNVHGLAQSAWDIRRLVSWIRRQDDSRVGLAGVSLGGYAAALTAALERGLAGVIAAVPISDFPVLFAHGFPSGRRRLTTEHLDLAQELHRVASPLAMASQVPRERRFVIGGLADGMADPLRQVLPLWHHWDQPATLWYEGGHVGYLCTSGAARFLRHALEECGLTPGAEPGGGGRTGA